VEGVGDTGVGVGQCAVEVEDDVHGTISFRRERACAS
jgi:hypothetical protein